MTLKSHAENIGILASPLIRFVMGCLWCFGLVAAALFVTIACWAMSKAFDDEKDLRGL
jgi:hypothetical protein